MTIHVVIPVFNRLEQTQTLVDCLRHQQLTESLCLLVVDDGSSDGTGQWLATQPDIQVLQGDGSLFWGGAVDLALHHLQSIVPSNDWVLLMNNDTTIQEDFVQSLLDAAKKYSPAVIGSVIRDEAEPTRLLSIGARVDAWRLLTSDLLDESHSPTEFTDIVRVDALSGRGVLFPIASILASGGMRPRWLPHYLADYELSARVRKYRIFCLNII
jgi:GT2 family glycosyltransferase